MRVDFDVPEDILHQLLDPVPIPPLARIEYRQPTPPEIEDLATAVREQLRQESIRALVRPGMRVAVGVGSRGLDRLPEIVRALVAELRAFGARPFVVPAMGSHGGATAEGQLAILRHLGVTPESVGAPVESQMETDVIGHAPDGTPVRIDRLALRADGICFVARVKRHTAYHGPYESGPAKMLAIGLGKQAGAAATHARGFGEMARMVPAMAEVVLANAPILFGLATLENAYDRVFEVKAIPADRILAVEPGLLQAAAEAMPRLPFSQLDVLVIDQIGKEISGDGADPNVTGRFPTPFAHGGPSVERQVVLDLTDATDGNATGIGISDFISVRAARKLSLARTYPNLLTSTEPGPARIPMILPSDRLAFAAALLTCHAVGREPRLVRIKDTLRLGELWVSEALLDEVRRDPNQRILEEPALPLFGDDGNLLDLTREPVGAGLAAAQQTDAW